MIGMSMSLCRRVRFARRSINLARLLSTVAPDCLLYLFRTPWSSSKFTLICYSPKSNLGAIALVTGKRLRFLVRHGIGRFVHRDNLGGQASFKGRRFLAHGFSLGRFPQSQTVLVPAPTRAETPWRQSVNCTESPFWGICLDCIKSHRTNRSAISR